MITITIAAFVILLILSVPVAFAVGMAGFLGLWWSGAYPLAIIIQQIFLTADSFVLLAIPLFILAGALMETGGIAIRLVRFAQALVGGIRGGLAMAVVIAEYIFSGISGSTIADVSAIGATMIPPMTKAGYEPEEAVSVVSAASAMGILVPPCILMIIIGAIANVSVAALFAGGFIPALVIAIVIMAYIYVEARRRGMVSSRRPSLREIGRAFVDALIPMGLPVIIFGGILGGVFTPTEAAAVAVLYAAIVGLFVYKEISWSAIPEILLQSAVITASVCFLLGTAAVVAWILTVGQVPAFLVKIDDGTVCRTDGLPDPLRDPVHPPRRRDRGTCCGGDPSADLPARRKAVRYRPGPLLHRHHGSGRHRPLSAPHRCGDLHLLRDRQDQCGSRAAAHAALCDLPLPWAPDRRVRSVVYSDPSETPRALTQSPGGPAPRSLSKGNKGTLPMFRATTFLNCSSRC